MADFIREGMEINKSWKEKCKEIDERNEKIHGEGVRLKELDRKNNVKLQQYRDLAKFDRELDDFCRNVSDYFSNTLCEIIYMFL